jgi:[FeFe] hydrogenase H-cluster maturation GTPase HydF
LVIALTFADRELHPCRRDWFGSHSHVRINSPQNQGIDKLLKLLEKQSQLLTPEITPLEGLVKEGDLVLLVTPIDLAAPKGRLILPQVETLRDALDRDCAALVVKERELAHFYNQMKTPPALVITDSQAFSKVAADLPEDQPLTSFSLLFARKKGDIEQYIQGMEKLEKIPRDGKILVLEGCSHHKQAEDIGTVKIPRLFRQMIHSQVSFHHARALPEMEELRTYHGVIHCGACMMKRREVSHRLALLEKEGIPVTNYGLFLG